MLAKAYQVFLSKFVSHGPSKSILPANSWLVPDRLGVREANLPQTTLDDADRAFLARQRPRRSKLPNSG